MKSKPIVVVGSGFSGSILARFFAEKGYKVTIYEKRNHTGGNMYDFLDENGIRIQKYGPHTFHTNIERVNNYINKFCTIIPYHLKCSAIINNIETPSPFNFKTIDQFYSENDACVLKNELLKEYKSNSATILEMLNSKNGIIKKYADFLFDNDYKLYTAKQWGLNPNEIDPYVLKRVPVIFNYNDTYFNDKYEGMPKEGFSDLLGKIIKHNNIQVKLSDNALKHISFINDKILFDNEEKIIVFTGPIDELFDYKYGKLPYRSLYFEYETLNTNSYQSTAIVAHPSDAPYTRITEYTKLPFQKSNKTVIAKEYSVYYDANNIKGNEPYYPIVTEESSKIYGNYLNYSKKFNNLILCGRLADFKYYNMDLVIDRTLKLCDELDNKY